MNTKNQIRLSSQLLFAELGYEGTSLTKIAEQVGIKKASIYSHYENKEAIFLDVIKNISESYVADIRKSFSNKEGENVEQQMKQAFFNYIESWSNEEDVINKIYNRLIQFPPVELKEKIREFIEESERLVDDIVISVIVKGQKEGIILPDMEASKIAYTFFSLIVGIISESSYKQIPDNMVQATFSWEIFWRGIRNT
ncbi:TetR/AcrR family transcriptional regulator [Oceanobacillus manasiensis]|uniref:TetR/AcrR family transcriptional regulator n=1 Tax=Oceanobacillus manasiensis TaxID=586413 RepID=UPI0005A5DF3B|nr:TetR/AcrR family transcriptional regulator [Oceanobacillus manasiensis]